MGATIKSNQYLLTVILFCCFTLPVLVSISLSFENADQRLYAGLLKKHVKNGIVDYKGLKHAEQKLDQYLKILDQTNPANLSRNEQFALYINAYNAYTLKLILQHYPGINSIKDIGRVLQSPWKIKFCKIGGKTYTLDEIEHNILRPRFKDPRIHFAVNCASKSCPPLIVEPYLGGTLDQQLHASARAFINNPARNYLQGNTLFVSSIFKWFKDDFQGNIVSFFLQYAEGDLREHLFAKRDQIRIKYLQYDWSLNGK